MKSPTQEEFRKAATCVTAWKRPLLLSHTRPDGDALGSLLAMRGFLRATGSDPLAVLYAAIPDRYAFCQHQDPLPVLGSDVLEKDLARADGVLLLDTCAAAQIEPVASWLAASRLPKVAVDHHVSRDELADVYLVDESAAANCLILYQWALAAGWRISHETSGHLFMGLAMDTGWFRHSNTDARVLSAAADLTTRGAVPHALYDQLFNRETPGRIRLLGAAVGTLELHAGGRLGVMTLGADAFHQAQAGRGDTEDIVEVPLRIASVYVSVLLVEQEGEGLVRVSLRSRAPECEGDLDVDVAAAAQRLGGGGHRRAAGARIPGTLHDARRRVVELLEKALLEAGNPH